MPYILLMENSRNFRGLNLKSTFEMKIIETELGIKRFYKSCDGEEYAIPESLLFSSDVD